MKEKGSIAKEYLLEDDDKDRMTLSIILQNISFGYKVCANQCIMILMMPMMMTMAIKMMMMLMMMTMGIKMMMMMILQITMTVFMANDDNDDYDGRIVIDIHFSFRFDH